MILYLIIIYYKILLYTKIKYQMELNIYYIISNIIQNITLNGIENIISNLIEHVKLERNKYSRIII